MMNIVTPPCSPLHDFEEQPSTSRSKTRPQQRRKNRRKLLKDLKLHGGKVEKTGEGNSKIQEKMAKNAKQSRKT